jgi:hypothetical protein
VPGAYVFGCVNVRCFIVTEPQLHGTLTRVLPNAPHTNTPPPNAHSKNAQKAGAAARGAPLFRHIADLAGNAAPVLPVPSFNVVRGCVGWLWPINACHLPIREQTTSPISLSTCTYPLPKIPETQRNNRSTAACTRATRSRRRSL